MLIFADVAPQLRVYKATVTEHNRHKLSPQYISDPPDLKRLWALHRSKPSGPLFFISSQNNMYRHSKHYYQPQSGRDSPNHSNRPSDYLHKYMNKPTCRSHLHYARRRYNRSRSRSHSQSHSTSPYVNSWDGIHPIRHSASPRERYSVKAAAGLG